jgi:hypothetical protein
MKAKIILVSILLFLGAGTSSFAQKASISTNLMDWANFGTANIEAGVSIAQHFSLNAGGHYNPWRIKGGETFNKQKAAYAGVRYWPWYVFSGWWFGAKLQAAAYETANTPHFEFPFVGSSGMTESLTVGAGLSFGYTLMLHQNINLEFGAGLWGGRHLQYARFETPDSMNPIDNGPRNFLALDDVSVSIMYVF